jgi:FlaA1/EpsC-like NDP-sugar epimerase
MIRKFLLRYSNKFVSRYLVLASDLLIVVLSLITAYLLRFNFDLSTINLWKLPTYLPVVVLLSTIAFLITRSYVGIIRHTSTDDVIRIFKAIALVFASLILLNLLILLYSWPISKVLPLSIIIIHSLNSLFLMIFTRLLAKVIWLNLIKGRKEVTNVIIYGAGKAGMLTKNTLIDDINNTYHVICFVDDNPGKIGKSIEGVPVLSSEEITPGYIKKKNISEVIIAVHNIEATRKREIADAFLQYNVSIKNIPPVEHWINGELQAKQISNVAIEDLLEREPILLDNNAVVNDTRNKVILVTGAAGSIGSEIARQLLHYQPSKLILLDQAETPLHDLCLKFRNIFPGFSERATLIVADINHSRRMEWVFDHFRPDIVYHAAAYKHVPLMEENPVEAVYVNILGTRLLADMSVKYNVRKFVMVSTDKAVRASNVMGASKRVAEIYTQSLNTKNPGSTRFITTRFGNVLGSSGSVIPIFRKQIEAGGPVTVTHPEITRFFMTIPEACQLVLEAGAMGNGGEIYMFDMGQPIKIADLARNMIRLSGLQPDIDIKIVYSGLRPGEKLFEELLNSTENTLPTYHPRIMIAQLDPADYNFIIKHIDELEELVDQDDLFKLVGCLKKIVPDYRSNNSIYESLDKPENTSQSSDFSLTSS